MLFLSEQLLLPHSTTNTLQKLFLTSLFRSTLPADTRYNITYSDHSFYHFYQWINNRPGIWAYCNVKEKITLYSNRNGVYLKFTQNIVNTTASCILIGQHIIPSVPFVWRHAINEFASSEHLQKEAKSGILKQYCSTRIKSTIFLLHYGNYFFTLNWNLFIKGK